MSKEKLQFDIQRANDVALGIFLDEGKGYFSRGTLERALREAGCDKSSTARFATAIIRDIMQQIADEQEGLIIPHTFSGLDLHPRQRKFISTVSHHEVVMYYAESKVKGQEAERRYEAEEQAKIDRDEEAKLQREKEAAMQQEAARRPSDVVISLVPYRKGSRPQELGDYLEASDEVAEAKLHRRLIPDQSIEYPMILSSFISEKEAFRILAEGTNVTDFAQVILLARAQIISDTKDLIVTSEKIAKRILDHASALTTSRRGVTFFASTLLQRPYVAPVETMLKGKIAEQTTIAQITVVDPFEPEYFSYPVQAALNWMKRYEDQELTAYQEPLQQLVAAGDQKTLKLKEIMGIPHAFARFAAGETVEIPSSTTAIHQEEVDELLAPIILNDTFLTRGILTDVLRTGFLDRSTDKGGLGELLALALRQLADRFSPEEIVDALRFVPVDVSAIKNQIADLQKQVDAAIKSSRNTKAGRSREAQQKARLLQNQIPPLAQQLRQLEEQGKHPVYDRLLATVRTKTPTKEPRSADYASREEFAVDEEIFELCEMFRPNYQ